MTIFHKAKPGEPGYLTPAEWRRTIACIIICAALLIVAGFVEGTGPLY